MKSSVYRKACIEGEKPEGTYIRSGKKPEIFADRRWRARYGLHQTEGGCERRRRHARGFHQRNAEDADASAGIIIASIDFKLVRQDTDNSHHPVLIMPARLAKGLEFDVVLRFATIRQKAAQNEMQILYTICTERCTSSI